MVPREHGAWSMLLLAVVVGLGVGGASLPGILFGLAAVALFLTRFPLEVMVRGQKTSPSHPRRWFGLYLFFLLALTLPLLLIYQRWLLLPLAALALLLLVVYLYLVRRRRERTVWGELLFIAGLSLAAMGAHYAAIGHGQRLALLLWLAVFLYSGSSVFYVRMMVRRPAQGRLPLSRSLGLGRGLLLYQLLLWAAVLLLAWVGAIPVWALVAFLPLLVKSLTGITVVRGKASIRALGFMEVGHAALFALLLIGSYRWF